MKNKTTLFNGFALLTIFCLVMNSCSQGPVDVTAKIQEANNALMTAYESGDANVLSGFYTADAKMLPANMEGIEGPQAIAGFFGVVRNMGIAKLKFETVKALSYGDIAVEEGKYALYVPGDIIADQGKYIVTWKNEDGKWKVQRDIWTTNNPAPVQRAMPKDTVMIVLNYIKGDKVAQFEEYINNYLVPASNEFYPQMKQTIRMQKPVGKNQDGTFTYVFLMDPLNSSFDYDMMTPLKAKFGEEKAVEYMKMYQDCLKDGRSNVIVSEEINW